MTADAINSLFGLNERMLAEGHGLIGRAQQLCERILEVQGDHPDEAILLLQHDCALWQRKWDISRPIRPAVDGGQELNGGDES